MVGYLSHLVSGFLPALLGANLHKFTVATLRQDSNTRTLFLSLGLTCWTQGYGFPLWGESPWQSDQWVMVFGAGFRVNSVVVICCRFVSRRFSNSVVHGHYLICFHMLEAHQQLHSNSDIARLTKCTISNMIWTYLNIHIVLYLWLSFLSFLIGFTANGLCPVNVRSCLA